MKIPISVLVLIYRANREVLLIERADKANFWPSGSIAFPDEDLMVAAAREVLEETGIDVNLLPDGALQNRYHQIEYDIYPAWRYRYPPSILKNVEHWFSFEVPEGIHITLAPREHIAYAWLPYGLAAQKCFSPSNGEAILQLFSKR